MIKILTAISLTLTLFSCYTQKRATKQVNKAYVYYPAMVAEKTREWFPLIPTTTKVDTVYKSAPDSSIFYKGRADSLLLIKQNIKDSLAIRYKDSCRSVQDNYSNGFNLGYEVGVYDGMQKCIADTLFLERTQYKEDSAKIKVWQYENAQLKEEVKELTRKNKVKGKWNLYLGIFGLLALAVIYLMYKVGSKKSTK